MIQPLDLFFREKIMSNKMDYEKLAAKIQHRKTTDSFWFLHTIGSFYGVLFSIGIPTMIFMGLAELFLGSKDLNTFFGILAIIIGLFLYWVFIKPLIKKYLIIYATIVFGLNTWLVLSLSWFKGKLGWDGIGVVILISFIAHVIIFSFWKDYEDNVIDN